MYMIYLAVRKRFCTVMTMKTVCMRSVLRKANG